MGSGLIGLYIKGMLPDELFMIDLDSMHFGGEGEKNNPKVKQMPPGEAAGP